MRIGVEVATSCTDNLLGKSSKSIFLTIQLLPQFGFDYRTSKTDIFDHLTLKTVNNCPLGGFDGWF
jgi:hypothetical protein